MLPNNLDNAIGPEYWFTESSKPIIPVTDDDASIQDEQKRRERIMLRKAEAVLVIERKYQEIQSAGEHLGPNFLNQAIDLLLPEKVSIKKNNVLMKKHPSINQNVEKQPPWHKIAEKQLANLEKREFAPMEPSTRNSNRRKDKKSGKIPSVPREVICFKVTVFAVATKLREH